VTDAPKYGLDYRGIAGLPKHLGAHDLYRKVSHTVRSAQEKLLEQWVSDGLPLERADPKFSIGTPDEDNKITVKVWVEWRDLPGDFEVTIDLAQTKKAASRETDDGKL